MQFGRYYEEFEVGAVYKHWPGKTVTEYDDHLFCLLTMNHHPLHINDVYAAQSQQGRNVVVGPLVYSLALGMSVSDVAKTQRCPEGTVKTRLFHARQKLKNCLRLMLQRDAGEGYVTLGVARVVERRPVVERPARPPLSRFSCTLASCSGVPAKSADTTLPPRKPCRPPSGTCRKSPSCAMTQRVPS